MGDRPSRRQRSALIVLVLLSLTFTAVDFGVDGGDAFTGVRTGAAAAAGSVQRAAATVADPVLRRGRALFSAGADTEQLQRENARLRSELRAQALDRSRSEQLARLDLLAGLAGYRTQTAHVVAYGAADGFDWTATIDAGRRAGVAPGMTVVNDAGLVGRVTAVSGGTARVLLAVDPKSAVGTRLTGSGELGISRGNGRAPMRLQLLDPRASVQVGDQLTTGPYGATTYTPGVPIGRVAAVTAGGDGLVRTARVRPYVDFTALDVVAVVIAGPERGSTR